LEGQVDRKDIGVATNTAAAESEYGKRKLKIVLFPWVMKIVCLPISAKLRNLRRPFALWRTDSEAAAKRLGTETKMIG
jgi:hypothetical protein